MKKKIILAAVAAVFAAAIIARVLYCRPAAVRESFSACTADGKKISVELDITVKRHILAPTEYFGSVTVDGAVHNAIKGEAYGAGSGFWKDLGDKLTGKQVRKMWFSLYGTDYFDPAAISDYSVVLRRFGDDWLILFRNRESGNGIYYAPAETPEQARMIENAIEGMK